MRTTTTSWWWAPGSAAALVYANTLYEPLDPFYRDRQWAHIADWKDELAPHDAQAKKMLGVTTYPGDTPADDHLRAPGQGLRRRGHVPPDRRRRPVRRHTGRGGRRPVLRGRRGPTRRTCIDCGACMTGCPHNARNR